jgi:trans-aconitate methyltransferase
VNDREPAPPAWRTCLDVESQDVSRYPEHVDAALIALVDAPPRRVLDLGCSTGALGAAIKAKHPQAFVFGLEPARAAAAVAATRLDRVIGERLEEADFAREGIAPGSIDLAIAADVLEHVVNPWAVLLRLRPLLAADGRLIASIPNVRNAALIAALAVNGRWQYRERGLLDVTHLRFFTLEEIGRMFAETGYRVERHAANVMPALAEIHRANRDRERTTLTLGKLTLSDLTRAELDELCAEQFLVVARPA